MSNLDNGYVSNYLIHWTGKDKGYDTLLSILTENRLRFGANVFARLGLNTVSADVKDEMIWFTRRTDSLFASPLHDIWRIRHSL